MKRQHVCVAVLVLGLSVGSAQGQNQEGGNRSGEARTASASPAIAKAPGLPGVKGTGTAGVIPLWTGVSTIGNSMLSQNGSNLSTGASITASSFSGGGSGLTGVNAAQLGGIGPSGFAQLGAPSNTFTGSISAAGVNSSDPYQLGGTTVLSSPLSNNIFLGTGAGNSSITGTFNTGIGTNALSGDTTGGFNTATGAGALQSNQGGAQNTAGGYQALAANVGGSQNTASGYQALAGNTSGGTNTGDGYGALAKNALGNDNTAVGAFTLDALNPTSASTGTANTAVGTNAGQNLTNGGFNTMIGAFAGDNFTTTETLNVAIANQGVAGDSKVIRIGTDSNQDPTCAIGCQTSTYIAAISTSSIATGTAVIVTSAGQLGVASSSRRYKEDIHDMGAASDGLLRLRPVTFRYQKAESDGSKPMQYGLVAEEVAGVYPELVVRNKDGQPETVQYYKLDAMLLNEIQKLARKHTADQSEIAKLQSEITEQKRRVQEQEAAMRQLLTQVRLIKAALANGSSTRGSESLAASASELELH